MVLAIVFSGCGSSAAQAATLTVGSSGYSTIQDAINASSSGDEILVDAGFYYECLSIGAGTLSIEAVGTVTLDSSACAAGMGLTSGASVSILDLNLSGSGLVADVASGASLTLDGVAIANSGPSSPGPSTQGGVLNVSGSLLVTNSTFTNNNGGLGGVIYTDGGSVTLQSSTFSSNSSQKGG